MKVEHILEQGSGARNEDYLIMDRNIFGVFDGSTSLDGACYENGESGGALASSIAGQTFLRNHDSLFRLGIQANQAIKNRMQSCRVDISCRRALWSTSAAVIRLRDNAIEWFQTGDSQVIFIDKDGGFRVAARREDHDYPTLSKIKEQGRSHAQVQTLIESVREGMNQDYGVLNGERAAVDFFQAGVEQAADVQTVLLFTDGLDMPCEAPAPRKDFSGLVDKARELGLYGLRDYVRGQEAADPDIELYPRFKKHDDIAAIAIHF